MSNTVKRNKRRPQKKINHQMRGKLVGLFAVVLLALVALLGRITYINEPVEKNIKNRYLRRLSRSMKAVRFRQSGEIFMTEMVIFWPPVRRCIQSYLTVRQ